MEKDRFMSANLRLTRTEYDRFVDFMRHYAKDASKAIWLCVSVHGQDVPEELLLDGRWDGQPLLQITDFKYWFELRPADS
jgi:hypothetical protein